MARPQQSNGVSTENSDKRNGMENSPSAVGSEGPSGDSTIVTTQRSSQTDVSPTTVRSISSVRANRQVELRARYGGFYWGSDFIGFAVATFFAILFLGIIAAVAGGVGYQVGAPLPKVGHAVSSTTQNIGLGAAVASLIGLLLAYFTGGYTAGRMSRYDGVKNGVGVVIWTFVVAAVLAIAGAILGSKFNVASQLHLKFDSSTFTTAGVVALVIALVIMLVGAVLGGHAGERYHRAIDRDAGVTL